MVRCISRTRWSANIPAPTASGAGNMCFLPKAAQWTPVRAPSAADALALPTEGVRKTPHELRAQPHDTQQLGHALLAFTPVSHAIGQQRLTDDIQQRHARIQRGEAALKSSDAAHLAFKKPLADGKMLAQIAHLQQPRAVLH